MSELNTHTCRDNNVVEREQTPKGFSSPSSKDNMYKRGYGGCDTYAVNIIKYNFNMKKEAVFGVCSAEPCFNLSYSIKFKSEHILPEKKLFWASLYYLLINIYGIRIVIFHTFRYLLGFLGVCK